ncbi:MAG: Fe-S cluster assembly protein SufD [Cyclonatronaceae bacterium]
MSVKTESTYLADLLKEYKPVVHSNGFIGELKSEASGMVRELPFPNSRMEDWRTTSLRHVYRNNFESAARESLSMDDIAAYRLDEAEQSRLTFVNGRFMPELSDTTALPEGMIIDTLAGAAEHHPDLVNKHLGKVAVYENDAFVPFNTATFEEGAFIYIPKEMKPDVPVHLLYLSTDTNAFHASPRCLIVADRFSDTTVIEDFVGISDGLYFNNAVTEAYLHEESHILHVKVQRESLNAAHISRVAAYLSRSSTFNSYTVSLGAALFRNEPLAVIDAENAHATLDGLVMVNGSQISDTHSILDHRKPNCTSHQLHKTIANGSAESIFNGKIFVRKDAQQTNAFQENRNLQLSSKATVFTKPQLEIFADDVKCSHGATVGQLSQDEMFYMKSRGLTTRRAQQLLIHGYAIDVIENIPVESLRNHLEEEVKELILAETAVENVV